MSPGALNWSHVRPLSVFFRCGTGLIRLHLKPLLKYWRPHVLHSVSPPTYTGRFVLSWLFVFIASSLNNYKNYAGSRRPGFRSCPLGRCPAYAVGLCVRVPMISGGRSAGCYSIQAVPAPVEASRGLDRRRVGNSSSQCVALHSWKSWAYASPVFSARSARPSGWIASKFMYNFRISAGFMPALVAAINISPCVMRSYKPLLNISKYSGSLSPAMKSYILARRLKSSFVYWSSAGVRFLSRSLYALLMPSQMFFLISNVFGGAVLPIAISAPSCLAGAGSYAHGLMHIYINLCRQQLRI